MAPALSEEIAAAGRPDDILDLDDRPVVGVVFGQDVEISGVAAEGCSPLVYPFPVAISVRSLIRLSSASGVLFTSAM